MMSISSNIQHCLLFAVLGSYDDVTPRQFFNVQVQFSISPDVLLRQTLALLNPYQGSMASSLLKSELRGTGNACISERLKFYECYRSNLH